MDREEVVAKAKSDFQFLQHRVLGVTLYGSWVQDDALEESDIDVCIVAPEISSISRSGFKTRPP